MANLLDEDPERFRRMIEINLIGSAYVGMAAARAMVAQGRGGAILNTVSGAQSGSPGMSSYGASKGGVAALTYSWAIELASHGIRVNAISPQAQTRTARSIDPMLHHDKPPERCAPAAVFLMSDLARDVTGQVVFVVGDELALVSHPAVVLPSQHNAAWTVESIAAAFRDDLALRQMPVGRSRQRIEVVSASDSFDAK
ncbi:N-acylmannosamine 1-dehydrogenase, putative [Ricinus communis]|uniref:N-acylmannosamine 1-dehydrogenase, putative n=1 Tax=Ricinus communis TaxID=3988 RepID=B9TES0_RICCO|nr:N-acylmannosamine 1-dehydrogenase, putative [Ricinus communis]